MKLLLVLGSCPVCTIHQEQSNNTVLASCSLNYSGQRAPIVIWYTQFGNKLNKINESWVTNDTTTTTVNYSVNISDLLNGTTLTCWIPFSLSEEYHHANAPYNGYSIWNSSKITWSPHQENHNGLRELFLTNINTWFAYYFKRENTIYHSMQVAGSFCFDLLNLEYSMHGSLEEPLSPTAQPI